MEAFDRQGRMLKVSIPEKEETKTEQRRGYEVHTLFTEKGDGYTGPMSPVLFADEIMKQIGFPYNRLGRIWFDDSEIHNWYESGEGLTGCDTLMIGGEGKNGFRYVAIVVDMGVAGMPAYLWQPGDSTCDATPIYEKDKRFAKKITPEKAYEIIQYALANNLLAPEKKKVG